MTKLVKSWVSPAREISNGDRTVHDKQTDSGNSEPRRTAFRGRAHPSVDKIIRVNQAGERAAVMIYAGQTAVLRKTAVGDSVQVNQNNFTTFYINDL